MKRKVKCKGSVKVVHKNVCMFSKKASCLLFKFCKTCRSGL